MRVCTFAYLPIYSALPLPPVFSPRSPRCRVTLRSEVNANELGWNSSGVLVECPRILFITSPPNKGKIEERREKRGSVVADSRRVTTDRSLPPAIYTPSSFVRNNLSGIKGLQRALSKNAKSASLPESYDYSNARDTYYFSTEILVGRSINEEEDDGEGSIRQRGTSTDLLRERDRERGSRKRRVR